MALAFILAAANQAGTNGLSLAIGSTLGASIVAGIVKIYTSRKHAEETKIPQPCEIHQTRDCVTPRASRAPSTCTAAGLTEEQSWQLYYKARRCPWQDADGRARSPNEPVENIECRTKDPAHCPTHGTLDKGSAYHLCTRCTNPQPALR